MKHAAWIVGLLLSATSLTTLAALPVVPLSTDQQSMLKSKDSRVAKNKKLVFNFWREVFDAHHLELVDKYMAEDYRQHNPNAETGRQGFVDYFAARFKEPLPIQPEIKNLVTILGEGDLVVLVFKREQTNSNNQSTYTTTWFDMFRIENDKIAEHWDPATLNPSRQR
jgi:predicted SnoaL-like aldol condensation-catalyzing enzyme